MSKTRETYIVSFTAKLPEGLNVEPGALVSSWVQRNPHGVFLKQRRQAFVHRQVLITFNVEELEQNIYAG